MSDDGFWDTIKPVIKYISFNQMNGYHNRVKFLNDDPDEQVDKYGNPQFLFDVLNDEQLERTFAISSRRLMAILKDHAPLAGKWFLVQRVGVGFETDYKVQLDNGKEDTTTN